MLETNRLPKIHRLRVWLGKFLGYRFVPEQYVCAIYRDEMYYGTRGPGFVHIDGWHERAGALVHTAMHFATMDFVELPTKQGMQVGLKIYLGYAFDPSKTQREIAMQLVNLNADVMRALVHRYVRWGLLRIVPQFDAEAIARAQVFQQIERALSDILPPRLQFVGIELGKGIEVQGVILPERLKQRYEQDTQLGSHIAATKDYAPTQVAQALAAQVVEQLNLQSAEGQYVNLGDAFSSYKTDPTLASASATTIEHQPGENANVPPPPQAVPPRNQADSAPTYLDDPNW